MHPKEVVLPKFVMNNYIITMFLRETIKIITLRTETSK